MDFVLQLSAWCILLVISAGIVLVIITLFMQLRWMVPYVPTPKPVIDAMITMAALKPGDRVYDLGAGDGRVLKAAIAREPGIRATGYEGALGVWILSKLRLLHYRKNVRMVLGDFMTHDLSDADVIFTYLSTESMKRLKPKFDTELKEGARVITHAFRVPNMKPDTESVIQIPLWGVARVYRYVWRDEGL